MNNYPKAKTYQKQRRREWRNSNHTEKKSVSLTRINAIETKQFKKPKKFKVGKKT